LEEDQQKRRNKQERKRNGRLKTTSFPYFIIPSWDRPVSIMICYGPVSPGIESRFERDFLHPDRPWGPPSLLYNRYWVFPRGKSARVWC
jgi:hypothetical protein